MAAKRVLPAFTGIAASARDHYVTDFAAAIGFRVAIALVPLAVVLGAASALTTTLLGIRDPGERFIESLDGSLPDGLAAALRSESQSLFASPSGWPLIFGLAAALLAGCLAMNTVVKSLNIIHGTEDERSAVNKWAVVIALTVGAGFLFVGAFVGFFALQVFGESLAGQLGLEGGSRRLLTGIRWPAALIMVMAATAMLYKLAPAKPRDSRWVTIGGLAFGVAWVAGTSLFVFYLQRLGGYDSTYGTLGAFLLLLSWLYITSLAFLVGAEIDAAMARELGEPAAEPEESRDYPAAAEAHTVRR